jgi:hypothetical protein
MKGKSFCLLIIGNLCKIVIIIYKEIKLTLYINHAGCQTIILDLVCIKWGKFLNFFFLKGG